MAEFVVENTSEPLTRAGVSGELSTTVDGREVKVILTWSPDVGVTEFWVIEETGQADVGWALHSQLAVAAAQAVVEVHAGVESSRRFEWVPEVEWGLRHIIGRDDAIVKPMLHASEEEAREEFERVQSYDLFARIAAGPWVQVKGAGDA